MGARPAVTADAVAKLIIRVGVGATLASHGVQKLFGWFGGGGIEGTTGMMQAMGHAPAREMAIASGLAEAVGGAGLALGLATPVAGAMAAGGMAVAIDGHVPNGFFSSKGGYEYPLTLGTVAATMAATGPGALSLDAATKHLFDKPWMRVAAVASVPVVAGVVIWRRHRALAQRQQSEAAVTDAVEEAAGPA